MPSSATTFSSGNGVRPLSTQPPPKPVDPPDADAGARRLSPVPGHAGPPTPTSRWATVPELRPPAAVRPATVSRAGGGRTVGRPASCGLRGACSRPGPSWPNRSASCPPRGGLRPQTVTGGLGRREKLVSGELKGERRVSPSVAGSCGPRGISPPRSGVVSRVRLPNVPDARPGVPARRCGRHGRHHGGLRLGPAAPRGAEATTLQ